MRGAAKAARLTSMDCRWEPDRRGARLFLACHCLFFSEDCRMRGSSLHIDCMSDPCPTRLPQVWTWAPEDPFRVVFTSPDDVLSLGEAWECFRVSRLERKKPALGTICNCSDLRKRLFVDWLDLLLTELRCPYPGEWRQIGFAFKWVKQSLLPPMDAVERGEGLRAPPSRGSGCAAVPLDRPVSPTFRAG
ncbi:hypothetical protein HMPREF0185_01116, partial [Brevundimonas diminuta 470-4]